MVRWTTPANPVFLRMLLANTLVLTGSVMLIMLPAYFESRGLARWEIGLADGCFWSISVMLQPFLGPRLDKDGRKRYLLLGSLLMALSAASYLVIPVETGYVLVARTLQGAGFTLYLTSSWTWLADHVPSAKVGAYFGLFGMTSLVGGIVGPGLAEQLSHHYGYENVFMASAGTLGAAFLILCTLADHPPERNEEERLPHFFGLLATRPMRAAAVGSLGFGFAIGPLFAFAAAYMVSLKVEGVAGLFAIITIASAAARVYSGRLMDRHGPAAIVLPSLALLAVGCLGLASLAVAGDMLVPVLALAGTAAGLGYGAIYPALNALVLARLPEQARGRAVSLATASIDLGSSTGVVFAGMLSNQLGYPSMFTVMGGAVLIAAVFFRITEM